MRTYSILIVLILAFSCKKESIDGAVKSEACGVQYPARELPWLRKIIEDTKKKKEENVTTITQVEVGGKTVFNVYVSYMSCIGCISYYCDGTKLDRSELTDSQLMEYQNDIGGVGGKRKILWPE